MFTGIVAEVGTVAAAGASDGGRLSVAAGSLAESLNVGASVAVEGVCLTVAEVRNGVFGADVSAETLERTTLGELRRGDKVNLEAAVAAGSPLGGHLVQGHVDGVGVVRALERRGGEYALRVTVPAALARYVVEKGSVAVAGISLTPIEVNDASFGAAVVSHTFDHTTLRFRRPGDRVNVEVDIVAKYVERFTGGRGGISEARLAELGFTE
jgi:riboflavin synthase